MTLTDPPGQLLSMATASVHDRLGKKFVRARRVFQTNQGAVIPVWFDSKGVLVVKVQAAFFHHDFTWRHSGQKWEYRVTSSERVRITGELEDEPEALAIAELRQNPAVVGFLLGKYSDIVADMESWLRRSGVPDDEAAAMSLKAFIDALDRTVYLPGHSLRSTVRSIMKQRLLNQIRDRGKAGTLIQGRRDIQHEDSEDLLPVHEIESSLAPFASPMAQRYAALIGDGYTQDEARGFLGIDEIQVIELEAELRMHLSP